MYYIGNDVPIGQLNQQLKRANRSSFSKDRGYREISSYQDWETIKPISKTDLRNGYPFGFLAVPMNKLANYHESSGTTGTPTATYFTDTDFNNVCRRFLRNGIGICADDMVLIKTPYALATTAHQMHQAARLRGAAVVPADNRSTNMPYGKVIRLLSTLPITVTWSLPSELLLWAEAAKEAGLNPKSDFPNLRAFLVAGEPLSPEKKGLISKVWGHIPVYEDYGSTETGSLAGQCSRGHLHLWSDEFFCEIDGTLDGKKLTGELLLTPLDREAMPLIRYRTGDFVSIHLAHCQCGSELPVIEVLGRKAAVKPDVKDLEEILCQNDSAFQIPFWRARRKGQSFEALEIFVAEGCPDEAVDEISHLIYQEYDLQLEVKAVTRDNFISTESLTAQGSFQKPKYIYDQHENWRSAAVYS